MIGLIGLTIAALGQIEDLLPPSRRPLFMGLVTIAMTLLIIQSNSYATIFVNQKTLWTYALKYNKNAWPAHDNLGNELFLESLYDNSQGRTQNAELLLNEAVMHYEWSLAINPNRFEAHNNLGLALSLRGRYAEAIDQYAQSLAIKSDYAMAHVNMADALVKLGRIAEARDHYEQALKIDPNNSTARDNLKKLQASP
jgi:tetratricopeptide (TPR) repeat protein